MRAIAAAGGAGCGAFPPVCCCWRTSIFLSYARHLREPRAMLEFGIFQVVFIGTSPINKFWIGFHFYLVLFSSSFKRVVMCGTTWPQCKTPSERDRGSDCVNHSSAVKAFPKNTTFDTFRNKK